MNAHQKIDVWSNQDVEDSLVEFFSSAHWTDYVRKLESGPHIRHAHIYNDGVVDPRSIARLLTFYFQKFDRSLQRRIKILPLNEDFMNVYNVHPKGQCHWEFFINYAPEVLVRPADAFSARAAHAAEFWDDAYMENYYKKFAFKDIGRSEKSEVETYFASKAWKENLLINIDEFGDVIHTHALVESSLHPEQLLKLGVAYFEKIGWTLTKGISVLFNNYGLEIGKLTYLLSKPEVVIEIEWHYNPEVTIREGAMPYFRISSAEKRSALLKTRPYVSFGQDMVERVISRLKYPV
jgi:hypothetical protein